jgi:cell migration-inducing and hyaluronan-binding protein
LAPILLLLAFFHFQGTSSGRHTTVSAGTPNNRLPSQALKWSDPATWNGHPPATGTAVTIPTGKIVLLDVSPPSLKSLTIQGTLIFADQDLSLSANWIMVEQGGRLQCGTETAPFHHHAVITLTGNNPNEDIMSMGTKMLGVMGGTLELHGMPHVSWTRLGATAQQGATQIVLDKSVDWNVGDRIAISSTDYDPQQAEEVTIKSISGKTITLNKALQYMHWGQQQTFGGKTLDERAEVELLSHNIVVQGDESSTQTGFGGHTMMMRGSTAHIEGVEFYHMGQAKRLGRYPIHWHLSGDANGSYAKNNSIDHTFNRCITIHATNKVLIQSNVTFDTIGHCYFLEDGIETNNVFENNLSMLTRKPADGMALLPSDTQPATFWITNPNNIWRGNVAAGSQGLGFWFAMPEHPTGLSSSATNNQLVWPRYTPLGEFSSNVAHSNDDTGLLVDNGVNYDGTTSDSVYLPRQNPATDSPPVVAKFTNFTSYKERSLGAWLRGSNFQLEGATLADNTDGAIFAADQTFLQDSLVVGTSENKGNPAPGDATGPDGRSLPHPGEPDMPISGYSFYDGPVGVQRVTFVNFQSNSQRPAGALSYLRDNSNPIRVENFVQGLQFLNANPVYLETPHANRDGDKAAVILDTDGSLTGKAHQYVVANNPILVNNSCSFKQTWNSYICADHYINFTIEGQAVVPLLLQRDDGIMCSQTGIDSTFVSISALPDRSYTIQYDAHASQTLQIDFHALQASDWVKLTLPYPNVPFRLYRDAEHSNVMHAANSLDELNRSAGDKYFYDKSTGLLYLKAVPISGRDWARINVEPA